ncbi:hypothetical protein BD410DRAFT_802509 [Rickenella mellea]|uniref:Uncharacterized protein n=1 Tax=Rickenella mellea TaxID=50990 RepID=A0A4Y7Q8G4_9AGAM|nr:hypothetical protein BD410DRAFT_802509 [Rickenella mellea]
MSNHNSIFSNEIHKDPALLEAAMSFCKPELSKWVGMADAEISHYAREVSIELEKACMEVGKQMPPSTIIPEAGPSLLDVDAKLLCQPWDNKGIQWVAQGPVRAISLLHFMLFGQDQIARRACKRTTRQSVPYVATSPTLADFVSSVADVNTAWLVLPGNAIGNDEDNNANGWDHYWHGGELSDMQDLMPRETQNPSTGSAPFSNLVAGAQKTDSDKFKPAGGEKARVSKRTEHDGCANYATKESVCSVDYNVADICGISPTSTLPVTQSINRIGRVVLRSTFNASFTVHARRMPVTSAGHDRHGKRASQHFEKKFERV